MEQQIPVGVVLADAGYGKGTQFRTELTQLGLQYAVGIESNATPGKQPLPASARKADGAHLLNACDAMVTISHFGKGVGHWLTVFAITNEPNHIQKSGF